MLHPVVGPVLPACLQVSAGCTVLWRFTVGDRLDIQFSITFSPDADKAAAM